MSSVNVYSYSRLSSWDTCKRAWKNNYIDGNRGEDNFFNTFGTLGHSVLEKVDRKEILPSQSFQEWDSRYGAEVVEHTHKWMDGWKSGADKFFKNFRGWSTEPVWVEEHFTVQMDGYLFQGYVDRLGRTKDGDLIMTDYKCAKPYEGAKLKEKARQLYLYSLAVHQHFGEYPKKLIFFHFKDNVPTIIPFKMEGLSEAVEWADRMVQEIENYEGSYPMQDNGYFCEAVCGYRNTCEKRFKK